MNLQLWLPCLYAFFACLGFSIIFEVHRFRFILAASLTGTISWLVYLGSAGIGSEVGRYFLATLVVATLSEILARVFKAPATIFLIVGIIPLVPGGGLYDTMDELLNGNTEQFLRTGMRTAAYAGAIAVGCSLISSVVRILTYQERVKK